MRNSLLTLQNVTPTPIEKGDAGIILKPDGSFQIFNCHSSVTAENMTEVQIEQGRKLLALSVALKVPQIMNMLLDMTNDPNIVGEQTIDYGARH